MLEGQVFFKTGGRWHFHDLFFFQGLSFLHLEIILLSAKLCYEKMSLVV